MERLVTFDHVTAGYGSATVLRDISMELRRGQCLRVEGLNGSGKSTLLRLAAGIHAPRSGSVTRPKGATVGYAPAVLSVAGSLSARRYLIHLLRITGVSGQTIAPRIMDLAERFGLSPGLDAPVRELSVGNRQIVNLMQAVAAEPDLLVLDEPFAALADPVTRILVAVLHERLDHGAGVLLVDHGRTTIPGQDVVTLQDGVLRAGEGQDVTVRLEVSDGAGAPATRVAGPLPGREADFLRPGDVVTDWSGS